MAGLTKAQREEREAAQKLIESGQHGSVAAPEQPLVRMCRISPEYAGGPVVADVNPSEVANWVMLDWTIAQ